jgi:aminoglycoside phosphotransferase (APT) family kinase protein
MGDDPAGDGREALEAAIAKALEAHLGPGARVTSLQPLTSGASRRSWRFDAESSAGRAGTYVLQEEMFSTTSQLAPDDRPLSMPQQALLLEAARASGVPVAPVVASGEIDGRQSIIAEWVDGEALPPKMLNDPALAEARAGLMDDCAQALASIHRIPPDGLGLRRLDRLTDYRARLDHIEPRPVLELGYRWLAEHRPPPGRLVVVHGDFRLGNLMVSPSGLTAVLDWEIAHLGDPYEDVAWATIRAWRFDRRREPGTFPEPDAWAEAYSKASGSTLDPETFRWWQIAGTWFWAVISAMQARRHLDGWVRSLEHAVIGRRVCESEWDLLELLP